MEVRKEPGPPPSVSLGPAVLPYSLDVISEYLTDFSAPEGDFDPNGDWDHRYFQLIALRGPAGNSHKAGHLQVQRKTSPSGVELTISQSTRIGGPKTGLTQARAECAADKLATPRKWDIRSVVVSSADGKAVPHTHLRLSGEAAHGSITFVGAAERRLKAPKAVTGSWSLFDALQRLPFDADPLRFDMLDDLELLKPRQQLAPGPTVEITIRGRKLRLHSFEQTGEGILPYCYWLDDQHRLLLAVGGVRTFIWDPNVQIPEFPR